MLPIAHRLSGARRRSGLRAGSAVMVCAIMSAALAEESAAPPAAGLTATPSPAGAPPTGPTPSPGASQLPGPREAALTFPTLTLGAATKSDSPVMDGFLDRLMWVESGGRDDARNPRSTAVGPFQFIESTFLDVARRHFAAETATLAPAQILALRTNRPFARRAAEAFTRDNADILANNALAATPGHLRLSFLVGPNAAVRLLQAEPATPVIALLGANVVQANPFMAGMAARDLVVWSERSIAGSGTASGVIGPRPQAQRALA